MSKSNRTVFNRTVEICPEVQFGFWQGFVKVNKRHYRAPSDSSQERVWAIIRRSPTFDVVLYDQTFFMGVATIPKEKINAKRK